MGATIKALEARRLLQILAEPNVLAINGKPASFLAGGEFPYPTLQGGGGGLGAVTIQFREFGVRINFTPVVTPRGTIRLQVTPEVSSLDFANGLVFQGFNIPALATRRVQTEIELEPGQSFVIGGLLDNRLTETLSKIPGLGHPFVRKVVPITLLNRNNTELLVMVTPEARQAHSGRPGGSGSEDGQAVHERRGDDRSAHTWFGRDRPGAAESPTRDDTCRTVDSEPERFAGSANRKAGPQIQFVPMLTPRRDKRPRLRHRQLPGAVCSSGSRRGPVLRGNGSQSIDVSCSCEGLKCIQIDVGLVIETKELWDEVHSTLQESRSGS